MSDLKSRIIKTSTIKLTNSLEDSEVYTNKRVVKTPVLIVNLALSGSFDGGFRSGLGQLAAPSKHFKSHFGLLLCKSFLDQYDDAVIIFMDSEFGTSLENFVSMGIDLNRVVHIPIKDIEELKIEAVKQLNALKRGDNVMLFVDSVGNLASRKEIEDAESGESKVDLTRAKEMKSVGRILTPLLNLTDIPMVVVNHVYKEIGGANPKYAKNVVSGGTGLYLSADWVWQIGKRQDKDGDDIVGNDFVIKIDKSRFVQEKSEFAVNVSYEDGISPYTGLFDLAIEIGTIIAPVKGYYNVVGWDTPNFRRSDKEFNSKFWSTVFERTDFKQKAESKYKLAIRKMIGEDVVEV